MVIIRYKTSFCATFFKSFKPGSITTFTLSALSFGELFKLSNALLWCCCCGFIVHYKCLHSHHCCCSLQQHPACQVSLFTHETHHLWKYQGKKKKKERRVHSGHSSVINPLHTQERLTPARCSKVFCRVFEHSACQSGEKKRVQLLCDTLPSL